MSQDALNIAQLNQVTIDFFMLADRAEAVNGKLYLMGGAWDRNFVQDFQQPVPISFAVGILVPWNATNQQHTVEITIEDADGRQPVEFNLRAGFVAGRPPTAIQGETQRVTLAVPVVPVKFPNPGTYRAVARVLGADERRVEFHLIPAAAPVIQPPPGGQLP